MNQFEWEELRDKVLSLPALENRMKQLRSMISEAEDDVDKLKRIHGKESADLKRLEDSSFSAVLFKLIGKYEARLAKEQQEEIQAKLAYDKAKMHLQNLNSDRRELGERISDLRREKIEYDIEMQSRRHNLAACSSFNGKKYAVIEAEHEKLVHESTQILEACQAAAKVIITAKTAITALESAEDWATLDGISKGGIVTHSFKYSHIDNAEQHIHTLSSQLRELQNELDDISETMGITLGDIQEISAGQRTVDILFDNIFTDISVRGKIIDNSSQIKEVLQKTVQLHSSLEERLAQTKQALAANRQREEAFIAELV